MSALMLDILKLQSSVLDRLFARTTQIEDFVTLIKVECQVAHFNHRLLAVEPVLFLQERLFLARGDELLFEGCTITVHHELHQIAVELH